jgi:asparagine synthase (glutamine-hydrolysing)
MCGIVGIAHLDGTDVALPLLTEMAATLDHRGPDDEGHLGEGPVGLYHKRLSIIDLETGHQPMTADGLTIVFNGEIYNYVELREVLRQRGHAFRTTSDTEVILESYREHGLSCVPELNGIFAFVLYDRHRHRLVAARDHFGVQPLYYWSDDRRVLFASEIKALLKHPAVRAEVDADALRDYLTFQFVLGDRTLFKGIRKVLPGHYHVLDLRSGDVTTTTYWEPKFRLDWEHTESYFAGRLRALLEEAVRIQLRSDVPLGTHLSGGMDSSVITTLAARGSPNGIKAFSGGFAEGEAFDERRYARSVAAAVGTELLEVTPTEHQFVELLPKLVYHMDEPAAGPGLFPQYVVSQLAAQHVKVALGGQGGDEIFGGYARYMVAYLEQALKGAIFETNEEREHIVSLVSILPNLPYLRQYVPMLRQFWRHDAFESMDRRYFRLLDRSGGALSLFTGDFREAYEQEEIFARFQRVFNHPDTLSYYNRMTHFDMVCSLPALLQVEDRVSMAVSLESRVPLLDHRIAELVASMPPAMKFKGGEMKYILRRVVQDLLPTDVLQRKDKMGFPVPLHLWAQGAASDFFHDILLSPTVRARGLFDIDEVEKLLSYDRAFGRRTWGLLNLELWHRQFIDNC